MSSLGLTYWGDSSYIFDQVPDREWYVITANSFEDRCLALPKILEMQKLKIKGWNIFKITNPDSEEWRKSQAKLEKNAFYFKGLKAGTKSDFTEIELDSIFPWGKISDNLRSKRAKSIILDISCLPKRHFLFCLRRLVESVEVEDLIVTYAIPESYPENALFSDIQPECSLPAFMREVSTASDDFPGKVLVSVGYTPRGLDSVMSSSGMSNVELVFPFPPGSPAFRRNWKFVSDIALPGANQLKIHMIHSYDAFDVSSRLSQWAEDKKISWYAYGSKPHSLGAALAYLKAPDRIELRYSQPRVYNSEYSKGIKEAPNGYPLVFCYCLKFGSRKLF
jgi:hypothetical protein